MAKFKVLVTDYQYQTLEYEERIIKAIDGELLKAQCRTEEEVITAARGVDALLVQYAPISRQVFSARPELKAVARYGVGVDVIDLEAATEHGVCVLNVPDYCEDEVADQTLSLLLACARKTILLNNYLKKGNWDYQIAQPIYRLKGKKLGLLGFGKIPRNLAAKAAALGLEVIAYDPYVEQQLAEQLGVELLQLEQVLKRADFVSVHLPLNENTRYLLAEEELKMMKRSAYLINTARGAVIAEKALINALRRGDLAGAALDVTEKEPINQDNPLLQLDNTIITPHVGWYSEEAQIELQTKAAQGVADVLLGKKPAYLVNQSVWNQVS